MRDGRARAMGLGPVDIVPLKDARQRAYAARRLLLDNIDPLDHKKAARAAARASQPTNGPTFQQCAERYVAAHEAAWKNEVHRKQWRSTLATYCYPVLGELSVDAIDTGQIMQILEPIWTEKPETAGRIQGRIENIWDWAKARGYCAGENPARWKGHLAKLLPAKAKVRRVRHHPALPYDECPTLIKKLNSNASMSAYALRFTLLCATRTSETIGAEWPEFDLQARIWTIPAERMKAGRPHRVPLSDAAMNVLHFVGDLFTRDKFVFAGGIQAPLSNMAMLMLLKGLYPDKTVHGLRSSFRDWAAEKTDFPREVAEAALAHVLGDKVEAAYLRGDFFEKRRQLMAAWAAFLAKK